MAGRAAGLSETAQIGLFGRVALMNLPAFAYSVKLIAIHSLHAVPCSLLPCLFATTSPSTGERRTGASGCPVVGENPGGRVRSGQCPSRYKILQLYKSASSPNGRNILQSASKFMCVSLRSQSHALQLPFLSDSSLLQPLLVVVVVLLLVGQRYHQVVVYFNNSVSSFRHKPKLISFLLSTTESQYKRNKMSDQQDSSAASTSSSVNVQSLKSQIANKLQANRPLVLKLHSVLTWEQDIHLFMVIGFVTLSFFVIHLLNSSIFATLSYIGIALALLDCCMPTIAKNLSSTGHGAKGGDKEDSKRFDKICLDLANAYAFLRNICDTCCSLKSTMPKLYYPALITVLILTAYIGNKFNNLFLTYIITLVIALYPGLDKRGFTQKGVEFVQSKLGRRPSGGKRN